MIEEREQKKGGKKRCHSESEAMHLPAYKNGNTSRDVRKRILESQGKLLMRVNGQGGTSKSRNYDKCVWEDVCIEIGAKIAR